MEEKQLTLELLVDFILKNDGMKGQQIAKALGFPKPEVNSMLYSDYSKGILKCDNNRKWHCTARDLTILKPETNIADSLTGNLDLTYSKRVSIEDCKLHPEIYRVSPMDEFDEDLLKAFCKYLDHEKDYECLRSFSPGGMNAYYLFLRNKSRYIQNPNFIRIAALLFVYALYNNFFTEKEISSAYSNTEHHLLERFIAKDVDTIYIKKTARLIVEKADSFAGRLGLPIIPLPIPDMTFSPDGIQAVPWEYITFVRGAALVKYPSGVVDKKGNPRQDYRIPVESANASWNMLKRYFARIPMFKVRFTKKKITHVVSTAPIAEYIDSIRLRNTSVKVEVVPLMKSNDAIPSGYSTSEFKSRVAIDKQPYFDELCRRQLPDYKILPFKERVVNSTTDTIEEGYAFVIRRDDAGYVFVAFENSNPTSRATLRFKVKESSYRTTMSAICQYLSSSKVNKRQELTRSTSLQASNGQTISYKRILHTDFFNWHINL